MSDDKSSKTEQPTARRLSQAREKGQVSKSMEINTCVVLMAAIFTLFFAAPSMFEKLLSGMSDALATVAQTSIEGADLFAFFKKNLFHMGLIMAPILVVIPLLGILSNIIQIGGFLFTTSSLAPNLSKINPISGFSRLFSARSLVELVKSILKITVIALTCYFTIKGKMDRFIPLGDASVVQIGHFTVAVSFEIFLKTIWALVVMAILDIAFQKWQFVRDMKMSKDEIKEEMKQTEGDPIVKQRIRSTQREMARKRMMDKVPEADVVVTNPTHLAVALMYDALQAEAPVVVAKGQNILAEKIKKIAQEHDIPIMEDKPLARALYKNVDIGQTIPIALYQAVAEVLSYVYRLKGKAVHGGSKRY